MRSILVRMALVLSLFVPVATVRADETLASAYNEILRGDFSSGRTILQKMEQRGDPAVRQASSWLSSFQQLVEQREELRAKTYDWNMEKAKEAVAGGHVFLALNFAFQTSNYAADKAEYARLDWVQDLLSRGRAEAKNYETEGKWSKALSYYMLMERISDDAPVYKALSKAATRHARLELVYADKTAIDRRIKEVSKSMLKAASDQINRNYYDRADFRKMANGALENVIALLNTTKVQKALDGVANPDARNLFISKLDALKNGLSNMEKFNRSDLLELYNRVAAANETSVKLPDGLLIVEFTEGMLGELDDFTSMIWPADAVEFDKVFMGGFEGVGIQLGTDERTGRLKVATPLEDSPALEAGVEPNDLIVAVDGRSTSGWTTDDAVREIMGPANSKVTLTMFRPTTGKEINFDLKRRKITLRTVRGLNRTSGNGDSWNYMLDRDNGIAYVRLTGFHADSATELHDALEIARGQGMKGLILDLRYNPGGLLDVAVDIVSLFVPKGEVVSTRGNNEKRQSLTVTGDCPFPDLPLLVLVNDHSASASEILAGALQDHNRAGILGERTFGKGSVQKVLSISDAARLKLTTALYYLPNGETPHHKPDAKNWGVNPDVSIPLYPKEDAQVLKKQNESMIIRRSEAPKNEDVSEEVKKTLDALKTVPAEKEDATPLLSEDDFKLLESDPVKAPEVDAELETALLQMRIKLIGNLPWPKKVAAAPHPAEKQP